MIDLKKMLNLHAGDLVQYTEIRPLYNGRARPSDMGIIVNWDEGYQAYRVYMVRSESTCLFWAHQLRLLSRGDKWKRGRCNHD